jgi:hypothetical protein
MLQPNFSLEISISTNSQNTPTLQTSKAESPILIPIKIRFAAVTSASLISTKEAVQSE